MSKIAKTILTQLNESPQWNADQLVKHSAYRGDPAADGIRAAKEDAARDRYIKDYSEAYNLVEKSAAAIATAIKAHRTKAAVKDRDKAINYGYVGDLGHVNELLNDILEFLK